MKKIDLSKLSTDTETQLAWLVEHERLVGDVEPIIKLCVQSGENRTALDLFNKLNLTAVIILSRAGLTDKIRATAQKLLERLTQLSKFIGNIK